MSKRYYIKPGGKITIEVSEKGEGEAVTSEAEEPSLSHSPLPGANLARRIVRRGRVGVSLYDLGEGLVHTGADITDTQAASTVPAYQTVDASPTTVLHYQDVPIMLTLKVGDDFSYPPHVNGIDAVNQTLSRVYLSSFTEKAKLEASGRQVYVAAPIPYACNRRFIRLEVNGEGHTLGDPDGAEMFDLTPSNQWIKREEAEGEGAELWRSFSVESGEAHAAGELEIEQSTVTRLAVLPVEAQVNGQAKNIYGVYETFDTGDEANFRIARVIAADGDLWAGEEDADLELNGEEAINVFLVPRMQYYKLRVLNPGTAYPDVYYLCAGRISNSPVAFQDSITPAEKIEPFLNGYIILQAHASTNGGMSIYTNLFIGSHVVDFRGFLFDESLYLFFPASFEGWTVAYIEQGERRYVVYRRTNREPEPGDFHPYYNGLDHIVL